MTAPPRRPEAPRAPDEPGAVGESPAEAAPARRERAGDRPVRRRRVFVPDASPPEASPPEPLRARRERRRRRAEREALRELARTHASYASEHGGEDNERLEFLGDAVLQLLVTEMLYRRRPGASEGEMTALRQRLVNTDRLAALARRRDLGARVRLGRGAELEGLRDNDRLLAGLYEADLAALYLAGGLGPARRRVEEDFAELIEVAAGERNAKEVLQSWCQARHGEPPRYEALDEPGPDEASQWRVRVVLPDGVEAVGAGRNKKAASYAAARAALEALGLS